MVRKNRPIHHGQWRPAKFDCKGNKYFSAFPFSARFLLLPMKSQPQTFIHAHARKTCLFLYSLSGQYISCRNIKHAIRNVRRCNKFMSYCGIPRPSADPFGMFGGKLLKVRMLKEIDKITLRKRQQSCKRVIMLKPFAHVCNC